MHTNYQPARRGLVDAQIANEKAFRSIKNHFKVSHDGMNGLIAHFQHQRLRYSDRGDFTRCYRGGF